MRSLHIGVAEVISDIVSQFAGSGLGAIKRVDGLGVIMIERVGVADDQPGQRSSVFFRMMSRVGFDSRIGGRGAVLQQLLRHRTETGGGNKSATHTANARRRGFALFASVSGGLFSGRSGVRRWGLGLVFFFF